ncbi:hypothetical protein BCR35DRAFT_306353 [Leucosporidium creatinivorum]|uniref:Uncharacterized protein n=1 Tax=Leucosporidium creatinivorum TaxID=106004 RepID=A0A1Y2EV28_9BASI|nr:hypothetical protein BCR35DRAFT_306353 [Leucosporidium creatinivorum]
MQFTRPLRSPATQLVRQTLLSQGPQTTSTLHTLLHSSNTPLPARPAPSNFLSGASRRGASPPSSSKAFPGQQASAEGSWSVSYLKKQVLKGMEERGEVVKITRGKWERAHPQSTGSSSSPSAGAAAVEADGAAGAGGKSATAAKSQHKHEEEHVWVVASEWQRVVAEGANARRETKLKRTEEREQKVGEELKRDYGVEL